MTKSTTSGASLRLVKAEPKAPIGARIKALRERIGGLSQEQVEKRSIGIAAELGPAYKPILRELYSKMENDHPTARLTTYAQRAVLARVFGLTTDEFSRYLDERMTLDEVMAVRAQREAGRQPASGRVGALCYRDHPRWEEFKEAARRDFDPGLTDETFEEMKDEPIFSNSLDIVNAAFVAQQARYLQNHRDRTRKPA
jgi:hypothetical protein